MPIPISADSETGRIIGRQTTLAFPVPAFTRTSNYASRDLGYIDLTQLDTPDDCNMPIDLTGEPDSDPDDLVFLGHNLSMTTKKKQIEEETRLRREVIVMRERMRNEIRGVQSSSSVSSSSRRSPKTRESSVTSTMNSLQPSRAPSHGPSSAIRPEINHLGSRPRPFSSGRDSEPPRKKARTRLREQGSAQRSPPRDEFDSGYEGMEIDFASTESTFKSSPADIHPSFKRTSSDPLHALRFPEVTKTPQVSLPKAGSASLRSRPVATEKPLRSESQSLSRLNLEDTRVDADPVPSGSTLKLNSIDLPIQSPTATQLLVTPQVPSQSKVSIDIQKSPEFRPIDDYAEDSDSFLDAHGSEEEYERAYLGLTLEDEFRWNVPICVRDDDEVIDIFNEKRPLHKSGDEMNRVRGFRTSRGYSKHVAVPNMGQGFVWEKFGQLKKPPSASRPLRKPVKSHLEPGYPETQLTEKSMRMKTWFKSGPGAVNRIEQHAGWVAIGCSRTGGQADYFDEEAEAYNCSGSLYTWNQQLVVPKRGHCRIPQSEEDTEDSEADEWSRRYDRKRNSPHALFEKHYSVNDVKFNNSGCRFVSTGMDKKVKVWRKKKVESAWVGYDLDEYKDRVPHDVAFQPGSENVIAVCVKDIHIYPNLTRQANRAQIVLKLGSGSGPDYNTGSILWDTNRDNILYASSEPVMNEQIGIHKIFDVKRGQETVKLRVNEAGDAMALGNYSHNNHGALALATKGDEKHFLRLFDIRRLEARHTQETTIEPFSPPARSKESSFNAEVSCMTFSPDGVYLALARSDNSVHLYDSRMIGRGIMHKYRHEPAHFISQSQDLFGVIRVQWISARSGQYGLVSGGEDGCVRLWNPIWSAEELSNGRVIAEVNSDVGIFSVGDPLKGEHELIVGDSSGVVTIFEGSLKYL